jgi:gliding motility-associated-like protein
MKSKIHYLFIALSVIICTSCKKEYQDYYVKTVTIKVNKNITDYDLKEFIRLKLDATSAGALSYLWTPTNETTPVIDYNVNYGTYSVNITLPDTIITYNINVNFGYCQLYCPSAFSPNGDGMNDKWKPYGEINYFNYLLTIYNEANALVFQTSDVDQGWDGRANDILQPFGVYYYHINYESASGKKLTKSGAIEMVEFD